jgi:3',5'-cyclic AMP phosphodiesterase CpdA
MIGKLQWAVVACLFAMYAFGAAAQDDGFTFVQMCDTQLGMGGYDHDIETFEKAVVQINALNPDFVIICGDLIDDTNDDNAFEDFKRIRSGFTMPCYAAPGNHDVGNEPTPELLARYRRIIGEDYFDFFHKGYKFIIVNTSLWKAPVEGETDKQDAWLREKLKDAADRNLPVFIAGHYPLFTQSLDEPDQYFNLPAETRKELMRLFLAHRVVGVLTGHTHRIIENEYEGIQLITSGTTSRNLDNAPMGFRVWRIEGDPPFKHEYVHVEGASPPADSN